MRKPIALALLAALVAVVAAVGLARPRPAAQAREHPAITEPLEGVAYLDAERRDAVLKLLLEDLRHVSSLKQAKAARAMARLGPDAAPVVPDLVAFLCDEGDRWRHVRDEIEDILVAIGEEAVPGALALIEQADREAWKSGISILARIRKEEAIPTLVPFLADERRGPYAADQLLGLGGPGRDALVTAVADESIPLGVIQYAVANAGKPLAVPLAALLDAPDAGTRERAAEMLERLGKNARPVAGVVLRALLDPRFGDRLSLLPILPSLREVPPEALRSAAEILGSASASESSHLSHAVAALAKLGPAARESLPALVAIMDQFGRPGATAAAAHWRISGDARVAVEHLVASIEREPTCYDGWGEGASWAVWTLAEMREEAVAAAPALLREFERQRGRVRRNYLGALGTMGEAILPALRDWLPTAGPAAARALMGWFGAEADREISASTGLPVPRPEAPERTPDSMGPEDLGWARASLRDRRDAEVFILPLRRLGEAAAPAVPDLIPLLEDDDLRPKVALTLASIGPAAAAAVPALEAYVEDARDGRQAIHVALWRITRDGRYGDLGFRPTELTAADDWAVPRLLAGLAKDDVGWRRDCVKALGQLGGAARPAATDLARIAADEAEDEYLRDTAREALASICR